jgi:D-glycero-D-manno-heptose 1,7-bisphosphate phosphatase
VKPAVFFDRDGVVNELAPDPGSGLPESPLHPDQVTMISGATQALQRMRAAGYVLVGTSNQPAAAKGVVPLELLTEVQARVLSLLDREGVVPEAFYLCFHHPKGNVTELTRACDCRKPAPGMLLAAAKDLCIELGASWMIGDTDWDVAAGAAAGCRTILIENPASAHKRSAGARPDARVPDLAAAADWILSTDLDTR